MGIRGQLTVLFPTPVLPMILDIWAKLGWHQVDIVEDSRDNRYTRRNQVTIMQHRRCSLVSVIRCR